MRPWSAGGLVALFLAGASLAPSPTRAANGTAETIQMVPQRGYSGGLIDLSGTGFKPYTQLILFMACPNYLDPSVYQDKNYVHRFGPTTDADGNFAGFLFRAPTLRHRSPPIGCQLYVIIPDEGPGFAAPTALYGILPRSVRLKTCQISMCTKVLATPKRVRAGLRERIKVHAWPGARVDVTLSYPKRDVHHVNHLDWQGNYALSVTVPGTVPDRTSVKVTVHAQLGKMQSTQRGNFLVMK